jgi:hypothetical protein
VLLADIVRWKHGKGSADEEGESEGSLHDCLSAGCAGSVSSCLS